MEKDLFEKVFIDNLNKNFQERSKYFDFEFYVFREATPSSQKTAEYVSKLFGKTDQYFENHSESRGRSSTIATNSKNEGTSKNFSIQERERIKPQDILQFDAGHFCGILVEGSNKEFNTRFKNISCESVSMPERNFFFDVESNFRAIHAQIKELVH